ncbi:hypothetical protein MAPG_09673 [Magnaporthiopsis poae ATCC 64411]|uniref:Uncharacterized protein n=1 Tax=Magnaporthiopsis poae (strain ATCC 64411 / 73-15) TaxID=644358 RepID=A0A0C4EAJ8_MAGP6|nr:hypothetical protein MAPG_09673 [Magnaporthiopsis poae ATCC 64411]
MQDGKGCRIKLGSRGWGIFGPERSVWFAGEKDKIQKTQSDAWSRRATRQGIKTKIIKSQCDFLSKESQPRKNRRNKAPLSKRAVEKKKNDGIRMCDGMATHERDPAIARTTRALR